MKSPTPVKRERQADILKRQAAVITTALRALPVPTSYHNTLLEWRQQSPSVQLHSAHDTTISYCEICHRPASCCGPSALCCLQSAKLLAMGSKQNLVRTVLLHPILCNNIDENRNSLEHLIGTTAPMLQK